MVTWIDPVKAQLTAVRAGGSSARPTPAMNSGVVPQQPPRMFTPSPAIVLASVTNSSTVCL